MAIWCWRLVKKRRTLRLCVAIFLVVVIVPYLSLLRIVENRFQTIVDHRTQTPAWKNLKRNNYGGDRPRILYAEKLHTLIEELTEQKNLLIEEYRKFSGSTYKEGNASRHDIFGTVLDANETLLQSREVNNTKFSSRPSRETNIENSLINLLPTRLPDMLNCDDIEKIKIIRRLGSGTSKVVDLGEYRGRTVAIKRVSGSVDDVRACIRRKRFWKESECYMYANYKVMKEILLGLQLQHPNILKLLGYCVRSELTSSSLREQGVVSVTEVGSPVKASDIKTMNWSQRLKLALEISSLLDYLEHSTLGSLIITDFKLDQMFFVNSTFKLGDMDDMNSIEGECSSKKDKCERTKRCGKCVIEGKILDIPCVENRCPGLNAKFNLNKFNQKLFPIVFEDPPSSAMAEVKDIMYKLEHLDITAAELYNRVLVLQNHSH